MVTVAIITDQGDILCPYERILVDGKEIGAILDENIIEGLIMVLKKIKEIKLDLSHYRGRNA